jgi:hypothetical protein
VKRLSIILEGKTFTLAPEQDLNNVYTTVLKNSIHEKHLEKKKKDRYSVLKRVLGTVVLLYSPLSIDLLPRLFYLAKDYRKGA